MSIFKKFKDFIGYKKEIANLDDIYEETNNLLSFLIDKGFKVKVSENKNAHNTNIIIVYITLDYGVDIEFSEIKDDIIPYLNFIDNKYGAIASGSSTVYISEHGKNIRACDISKIEDMYTDFCKVNSISFSMRSDGKNYKKTIGHGNN